ncbi:hypothetical protein ACFLR0_00445 [Candidatus Bipolaricaulota bacterium]
MRCRNCGRRKQEIGVVNRIGLAGSPMTDRSRDWIQAADGI